jgi:hypothetical protein
MSPWQGTTKDEVQQDEAQQQQDEKQQRVAQH